MSTITQFPSGNTQYRIEFDYLARTFIVVTLVNSSNPTLNRVLEAGRDYRFLNPTMIEVLVDQSGFDIVRIHRQTGTDLVVDFRNGSVLTASDLTNAELQAIHIAEEGRDQTVDLAKEYADAAGSSAGNAKDSEDEARRIAASIKAAGIIGYITRRSFEKGFNVTTWNEVLLWEEDGDYYRWDGAFPKIVPAGSTPATTGGVGLGAWLSVGDAALRQELLGKRVYAVDFGDIPDAAHPDIATTTIQTAIDYVYANGGGVVDLGPFSWKVAASTLNETYDNYGVPVSASTGCIILRKGVSLVGQYGRTKIYSDNPTLTLIYLVAPDGNVVSGFELAGAWSQGIHGAGHGIFQVGTQGGADISCKSTILEHLYIHNVGSYGIGLQNGNPEDCHINHIRTDTTGADGLDLKARDDLAIPPVANTVSDVWVTRTNLRLDGSAGVDIRGVWQASNITVTDFGGDATKSYTGIRFRTKPAVTDPYNKAAARSTLTGFNIMPTPGAAALLISGVECGSDDVHISNGTVEDCHAGVVHTGNAVGSAQRCSVTGVTSINARQYGFRNSVGCDDITYVGCKDIGSVAAGFRIEGANCTAVGCSGTLSIGTSASATFISTGGRHGAGYVVTERLNDAAVAVSAKGTAADISLRLSAKGNSFIGVNADIRPNSANTRYLGSGSLPWAGGFTQTAFTVTSGAKYKTDPLEITDAMLDAVEECPPIQYQLLDRVAIKGADNARWHFGTIAERLEEAFSRHGLDVRRYAFFCEDHVPYSPAVIDEETGDVLEPEQREEIRLGVRYEELLMLEAALQRRNYERMQDQYENLVARVETLESK